MITTKLAIENYLLTTIASTFDSQINEWIEGVYKEMCMMTDRQLIADDTDTTLKYDGNNVTSLMIDDFYTITKVEDFDSEITVFSYPANSTPKWRIDSNYRFNLGKQNIKVTGRRGAFDKNNIPADLKYAATVLVAGVVNYSNSSKGEIKSESIGRYSVTYTTESQKVDFDRVRDIIKNYRRIR